uniref:Uncharacterized protein n=1 Tax=Bombyx mori TaxID=7091 RepID=A0A8R2R2K0_BOMMO|nr:uncharacterized protein LOC119629185 [Bombyx mori]
MRHRYLPKQPCPDSTCVTLNDRDPCLLPSQSSSTGRIASTVARPAVGRRSLCRHSATKARRSSSRRSAICRCTSLEPRARSSSRHRYNDASTFASRSQGGDPARTQAAS